MGLFLSTTINRLDKKGRVSVPSSFRSVVAQDDFQGVVLFQSYTHECIEGLGMRALTDIQARIDTHFDLFSDTHDDMATILFGESVPCGFDADGRITLPKPFIEFAGITDQVAFVGLGNKFQIWSPERLETRKAKARQSVKDQKITLPHKGDT